MTDIRHVGTAWSVWLWKQQGGCVPRVARAPTGGVDHNALLCGALEVNGVASEFCSGSPMDVGHAHLWN